MGVLAIFRELDGKSLERAAVKPGPKAFHDNASSQLQIADGEKSERVDSGLGSSRHVA